MLSKREIKWINALKNKKYRYIEHAYIAEGPRLVDDLLLNGQTALKIFKTKDCSLKGEQHAQASTIISEQELKKISCLSQPHQVLGVFEIPVKTSVESHDEGTWGLALDFIQDPGNLGTIIRTMDWLGIHQIYCSNNSVDMYNPKVVQAAMGSTSRVNIYYVDLLDFLSRSTVNKYAADMDGKPINNASPEPGIIVLGNEGKGLSAPIRKICDAVLSVPRLGGGESLNVAVSAAIMAALVKLKP